MIMELKAFRMQLKIKSYSKAVFYGKQHACHGKLSRHICLQGAQLRIPCSPALPKVIITVVSPVCLSPTLFAILDRWLQLALQPKSALSWSYDTFMLSNIYVIKYVIKI